MRGGVRAGTDAGTVAGLKGGSPSPPVTSKQQDAGRNRAPGRPPHVVGDTTAVPRPEHRFILSPPGPQTSSGASARPSLVTLDTCGRAIAEPPTLPPNPTDLRPRAMAKLHDSPKRGLTVLIVAAQRPGGIRRRSGRRRGGPPSHAGQAPGQPGPDGMRQRAGSLSGMSPRTPAGMRPAGAPRANTRHRPRLTDRRPRVPGTQGPGRWRPWNRRFAISVVAI